MKDIKYIGFYDVPETGENRSYVLAATNKMTYICSALNRAGWNVEIVSASGTNDRSSYPGKVVQLTPGTQLRLFPTLGTGRKIRRILKILLGHLYLAFYLLRNTRPGAPVLVYHSLGYVRLIRFLKRIKRFRLILEVEEIYSDVTGNDRMRGRELRLFEAADAYLFPTELLDEKLNPTGKPSAIIYGTYQVEPERSVDIDPGKIHAVYAGTFDPRKGGAQTAVTAARHLPENYYVHVIGFGTESDKKNLLETIKKTAEATEAKVTYDGLLSGEDYIRFIQSCQIGFSTQTPDAAFNETSFPSKVLSYLANGLQVVSIRLKVLERSTIGHLLRYYEENTPQAIAEAVRSIDFSEPYDSRAIISRLDQEFVKSIGDLLNIQ